MLEAISSTSLLDDVYQEDPTTNSLETFIASLTGKEASLLVLSGTMGNQVAIRSHLQGPPHGIVTDFNTHIMQWEAGGVAVLCGALMQTALPSNGRYLTLEDIQKVTVIGDNVHYCPTKLISLENTLNGAIVPLAEMQRIYAWAKQNSIAVHIDGARLWEAVAAGAGSLEEYCACADSVSLCFSKGLGAPIGSILVGTTSFIKRARWIRKSLGGGLRQAGVVTAAMRVAVEDQFLGGKLAAVHERARKVEELWVSLGGRTAKPVETNMVWLDLGHPGVEADRFIEMGQKVGLRLSGGRLVVHHQIGDEAMERLERLMKAVLKGEEIRGEVEHPPGKMAITTE
jgi:threonine aldolase